MIQKISPCLWFEDQAEQDMLQRGDSASRRVLEALLDMDKRDISTLVQAHEASGLWLRPEVAEP